MTHRFGKSGNLLPPTAEELAAADDEADIIVLDTGMLEDGTPYWAYVAITPSKYDAFIAMTAQGEPVLFEEYGTLLKHGYDGQVPPQVKEEMRREYDFDEHYLDRLGKRLVEMQTDFLRQRETKRIGDIVAMLKHKQE